MDGDARIAAVERFSDEASRSRESRSTSAATSRATSSGPSSTPTASRSSEAIARPDARDLPQPLPPCVRGPGRRERHRPGDRGPAHEAWHLRRESDEGKDALLRGSVRGRAGAAPGAVRGPRPAAHAPAAHRERASLAARASSTGSRPTAGTATRSTSIRKLELPVGLVGSARHSPVSPSQHPTLNRQRGHWNVPCRHSIPAPQRMQISTYVSTAGAPIRRP